MHVEKIVTSGKEWEFYKHSDGIPSVHYEWIRQGQDMDYSLALTFSSQAEEGVWFELDATLTDPVVTESLLRQGLVWEETLKAVLKRRPSSYICWVGCYPEDVEELCQQARWPLPQEYKEGWNKAVAIERSRK